MRNSEKIVSGSIFDAAHTTAKNKLGTKVMLEDGREFIYVSTALDAVAGSLVASPAASAVTANAMTAAAIGATTVTVTLAGVTANLYAEGYLHLTDDTGQGYSYRIKKNTASGTANAVTLYLYDPLKVAIDTTTDFVLKPNQYSLVIAGGASLVNIGVCVVPTTAATAGATQYFWIQSKGPGVVLVNNASSLGIGVECKAMSAGILVHTAGTQMVAICTSAAEDAGGFQPVILCM